MNKPIFFDCSKENFQSFKERLSIVEIIDFYQDQLEELFLIRNPQFRFQLDIEDKQGQFVKKQLESSNGDEVGTWVYFPWSRLLCHYLPDEMHQELRTARNKNLITAEEQKRFYGFNVGIVGLSVGSHAALTLTMMGASKYIKLADPDKISGSNLNRVRVGFESIGINKCELVARQIYQMNPYAHINTYSDGIVEKNIDDFFDGFPKIDLLVEECDNLETKIRLRLEAKKRRIPVVMATDNGDNVIIDIERYDLDPETQIFNGLLGDITLEEFKTFTPSELPKLATRVAGKDVVVPEMLESLLSVGKTLYSWPQLGNAATLSGVAVAYVTKSIALGHKIKNGKLEINLDSIFQLDYFKKMEKNNGKRKELLKVLGLDNR